MVTSPAIRVRSVLRLLAINEDQVQTFWLPHRGTIVVGRSPVADLQLDHPQISRRHFELLIGDQLRLRDLGSLNGIDVGGRRVPMGETIEIEIGEALSLGEVTVVVQRAAPGAGCRTIVQDDDSDD